MKRNVYIYLCITESYGYIAGINTTGTSLAVQWLRFHISNARGRVQSLVKEENHRARPLFLATSKLTHPGKQGHEKDA